MDVDRRLIYLDHLASTPLDPEVRAAMLPWLDPARAEEMARTAVALGGRVAIHAIGDAANERVIDLMARLIGTGVDPSLLRIEHASVLTARDIGRRWRTRGIYIG